MIKRVAIAAGIAALVSTSACGQAPKLAQPVAVDGQSSVTDYLGGSVGAGPSEGHTEGIQTPAGTTTTVLTTADTLPSQGASVDIGTAARVTASESAAESAEQVEADEQAWQAAAEDAYVDQADQQPMEDEPGWDCQTMGNRVCGPMAEQGPTAGGDYGLVDEPADVEAKRADPMAGTYGPALEACYPELHTAVALRPVTGQQAADLAYLANLLVVSTHSLSWDDFRETADAYLLGMVSRSELIDPGVDTFPSLTC